jgi:hypothetical protein
MKIQILSVALGIVLSATVMNASAQKVYTEGMVTISTGANGQTAEAKEYFTTDSVATVATMGPATLTFLGSANEKFFAVLVSVPVASMKKAGVATPDDIDQALSSYPTFTFAPTTETKVISGFNCKKIVATDNKDKKTYDVWVTNDISVPASAVPKYYSTIGGFPVQYTAFQQGRAAQATVISVTDQKAPKGTFSIPSDYDKITLEELKAMNGNR